MSDNMKDIISMTLAALTLTGLGLAIYYNPLCIFYGFIVLGIIYVAFITFLAVSYLIRCMLFGAPR